MISNQRLTGRMTLETPRTAAYAIDQSVMNSLAFKMYAGLAIKAPPKILDDLDVPCRRCAANPGEKCVQWSHRKKRIMHRSHQIRVRDAHLASEAYNALNSG